VPDNSLPFCLVRENIDHGGALYARGYLTKGQPARKRVVSLSAIFIPPHQYSNPIVETDQNFMEAEEQDGTFTHHTPYQISNEQDHDPSESGKNWICLVPAQGLG
jgi:hypothetical protein